MGTTPKLAFRYPNPAAAPDGPGAVFDLATDLDNTLATQGAAPTYSGTNAALGTNGGTTGWCLKIGKIGFWRGRVAFGSGAAWGNPTSLLSGFPSGINTQLSTGYGWWVNPDGSYLIPFMLQPVDASTMSIRTIQGNASGANTNLGYPSSIGTPASGSQLIFSADLYYT